MASKKSKKQAASATEPTRTSSKRGRPPKDRSPLTTVTDGAMVPLADLAEVQAAEAQIDRLAAVNTNVKRALDTAASSWATVAPRKRLAMKNDVLERVFHEEGERNARLLNLVPPFRESFSAKSLREPGDELEGSRLEGGRVVDERALYRAFAILMDLMYEAADSSLRQAKPDCVNDTAEAFIELMDDFAISRTKEASWVTAHELMPTLTTHYEQAKKRWPTAATTLSNVRERLPPHPTPAETAAAEEQKANLEKFVASVGFDIRHPLVRQFVAQFVVSALYISPSDGSRAPAKMAAEAAAALAALGGDAFKGSTVHHYKKSKSHAQKQAAQDSFKFLMPTLAPAVTASDVLAALAAARNARAYYLRYLLDEDAQRSESPEDASLFADMDRSRRELAAAARLGLPRSAYRPIPPLYGNLLELATWDTMTAGPPIPAQIAIQTTKPFSFDAANLADPRAPWPKP